MPEDMEGPPRRRLLALSGKTHELHSSDVAARDGVVLWRHVFDRTDDGGENSIRLFVGQASGAGRRTRRYSCRRAFPMRSKAKGFNSVDRNRGQSFSPLSGCRSCPGWPSCANRA